jgi:DNA-binding winged helix-turn-helix (wHTH) protein
MKRTNIRAKAPNYELYPLIHKPHFEPRRMRMPQSALIEGATLPDGTPCVAFQLSGLRSALRSVQEFPGESLILFPQLSIMEDGLPTPFTDPNRQTNEIRGVRYFYDDALVINTLGRTCDINGTRVVMPRKVFDLLSMLSAKPDYIYTRHALFNTLWGGADNLDTSTLGVHMNRLRGALDQHGIPGMKAIETVRGIGYKMLSNLAG